MSPYEIQVLLWYHWSPRDHEDMTSNPPIWKPTIEMFRDQGLLEFCKSGQRCYDLTERGTFYVTEGLCKVPLPVSKWRIPNESDDASKLQEG